MGGATLGLNLGRVRAAENNTAFLNTGMQSWGEIRRGKKGPSQSLTPEFLLAHQSVAAKLPERLFFWWSSSNAALLRLARGRRGLRHPSASPLPLVISSHADAAPGVRVQGKSCFQSICRLTRGHSHPPTRTSCIGVRTQRTRPPGGENRKTQLVTSASKGKQHRLCKIYASVKGVVNEWLRPRKDVAVSPLPSGGRRSCRHVRQQQTRSEHVSHGPRPPRTIFSAASSQQALHHHHHHHHVLN